jgi:hypothetical protein
MGERVEQLRSRWVWLGNRKQETVRNRVEKLRNSEEWLENGIYGNIDEMRGIIDPDRNVEKNTF